MLSIMYFRKNRYPEAIAALEKACEAEPDNIAFLHRLSGDYLRTAYFDPSLAIRGQTISGQLRP
jgi:hypothetical protein